MEKGLTMDWWARKNDYVDGKGKEFLQWCLWSPKPPYRQTRLLHKQWAFSLHGVKLSHINKAHLYQELFGPRTLKYWNDHHDIPVQTNCDGSAASWSNTSGKTITHALCATPLLKQCHTSYTVKISRLSSLQNQGFKILWNQNSLSWKRKRLLLSPPLALQQSIAATFQSSLHRTHTTSRRLFGRNRKLAGTIGF